MAIAGLVTASVARSQTNPADPSTGTDRFFLRGKLVSSTQADGYICAQCHTK
jgi:hypothetical protein